MLLRRKRGLKVGKDSKIDVNTEVENGTIEEYQNKLHKSYEKIRYLENSISDYNENCFYQTRLAEIKAKKEFERIIYANAIESKNKICQLEIDLKESLDKNVLYEEKIKNLNQSIEEAKNKNGLYENEIKKLIQSSEENLVEISRLLIENKNLVELVEKNKN